MGEQPKPLPGLIKFYLLQLYPLAFSLVISRIALGFVGLEVSQEAILWSLLCVAVSVTSVIAIAGIHNRAVWAPSFNAGLCKGLALFFLAVGIRVLVLMAGMRIGRYGLWEEEMMLFFIPSLLFMQIPIFWAWSRYFLASPSVANAFGRQAPLTDLKLPGPGLAFLRVICIGYIIFFVTFLISLVLLSGPQLAEQGTRPVIILWLLPYIIFPALLLLFTFGRGFGRIFVTLIVFGIFMRFWVKVPFIFAGSLDGFMEMGVLYGLVNNVNSLPLPTLVLIFICGLLVWKIWSDPEERQAFTGSLPEVGMPGAFTIYGLILLYFSADTLAIGVQSMLYARVLDNIATFAVLLSLAFAVTAIVIALLWSIAKERKAIKMLSFLAFSGVILLALASIGVQVADMLYDGKESSYMRLIYSIPFYASAICVGSFALMHWRARYTKGTEGRESFFSMRTPFLAFAMLCAALMAAGLSRKILEILFSLLADGNTGYWTKYGDFSIGAFSLGLEFWAAYLVCPIIALRWLKQGLKKLSSFYVLCAVWVFSILLSINGNIANTISQMFGMRLNMAQILDPLSQIYLYSVITLAIYLSVTEKRKAGPEGVAN